MKKVHIIYFIKTILFGVLRFYKKFISPFLPMACRFYPTCSDYAYEAIRLHGIIRGLKLAMRRVFNCHPFGKSGVDFVPLPDCCKNTDQQERNL